MRGFEDSSQPVRLFLNPACLLGSGPFDIDGAAAELTADGITADVSGTRYWVPTHMIDHIEQLQVAGPVPSAPESNPGQSAGQGGGRDSGGTPPTRG